ncbi:methyltransferase domain-containing protein [Thalassococcus profundi]|uniref:Methyltransferase domain-containing protein n=1 Tax=Thalassococcus profundi TaxID=2282382 RepID=A0A369TJE4_9RHOB|nr:methyltransferase domain-containing protein [Thalassococcus profundi]RDD65360.1 methyltransferase domain-containing protein [Thalassococcus profundi]
MDIQSVKSSYARWAPIYDRTFGAVTRSGRRRAVDYINRKGGPKVLEVGVGTGLSLQRYAPHLEVWGIDFSHEMLAKAKRKVSEQALTHVAGLQQMDARELDFPDASFDTVAAMHIVSVVPEPERVLAEMARVCKPGGEIVITNHFASEDGVMARIEKLTAPFADMLGWHSDFRIETVLDTPDTTVAQQDKLPPLGMMTFLVLRKAEG